MKQLIRSIYAVALVSLAMTGCSKDPDGPVRGGGKGQVSFTSNIDRPESVMRSRVDGASWTYGDVIGVYMLTKGGSIANPADIVMSSANRRFLVNDKTGAYMPANESQAIFYPLTLASPDPAGHDFDFVAYHPYATPLDNFKVPVNISENKPVLTAKGQAKWPDYTIQGVTVQPVNLTFEHRMARIKLNIKVGEGMMDSDLRNMVVTYVNANAKGAFNILDNKFEDTPLTEALANTAFKYTKYEPTAEEKAAGVLTPGAFATLVMIPNAGTKTNGGAAFPITYRSIKFGMRNNSDKTGLTTYDITYEVDDNMVYEAGKEYVYNVTINRDQVIFEDLEIENWEPEPELTVEPEDVEDMESWRFRRSIYYPNTYIWESKTRTATTTGVEDKFYIPIMKAFSMWEHDKHLKNVSAAEGGGPLPDLSLPENAGKTITAEIIWGDTPDIKNYRVFLLDTKPNYKSEITIGYNGNVPLNAMAPPINMLIGLKVSGETGYRWTWHVWVVEFSGNNPLAEVNMSRFDHDGARDGTLMTSAEANYDPQNPRNYTNDYGFLGRNLGARLNDLGPENTGMYYQWGRPTPFPGATNFDGGAPAYVTLYKPDGTPFTADANGLLATIAGPVSSDAALAQLVRNPVQFVTSADNWITPAYIPDMWTDDRKSPWDPCPNGWRIPAYKNKYNAALPLSPWNNPQLLYEHVPYINPMENRSESTTPADYGAAFTNTATSKGYRFNAAVTTTSKYKLGWYPASGYRAGADGALTNLGTEGFVWSSTLDAGKQQYFAVSQTAVNPYANDANITAKAFPVRCVEDK